MHAHDTLQLRRTHGWAMAVPALIPLEALAQAAGSPFMTGATALQTNILAWLTPIAVILVMALGAMAMANRLRSEVAERLRADYRERVQRRLERSAGAAARTPAPPRERELAPPAAANADIDEVRRRAREAWLALRSQQLAGSTPAREAAPAAPRNTRERDAAQSEAQPPEDLAL